jgi:hypothetical protein
VRPDHLEWAAKLTGTELKWGKDLSRDDLAAALQHKRDQHAKYQRNYRANLKRHNVRGMREIHLANLADRAAREVEFRETGRYVEPVAVPHPLTPPESTPGGKAVPPSVHLEPEIAAEGPSELGSLLGGVKVAPAD